MKTSRRQFIASSAALGAATPALAAPQQREQRVTPEWEAPLFGLHSKVREPVKVESIEALMLGSSVFIRARSAAGATGVILAKGPTDQYVSILLGKVLPFFVGKDARDLETLVDEIYIANYKMAGQPFWLPVAGVELALWDLLGRTAKKPVHELMGGAVRKEIPVYLSGSGRDNTAEEEVDIYVQGVEETGADAVKFKIGGRMSRNLDAYPGRTATLLPLARRMLGGDIVLYADANGSYNAAKAIEIGRELEDLNFKFFEEPCPWEELSETKTVANALDIPIAFGEQDSSLWRFNWMLESGLCGIVQPDINYNGGLIRAARVARMARKHGRTIVPHNTQTGPAAVNILNFAAVTPNVGPYMEFPWRRPFEPTSWASPQFQVQGGVVKVPEGPGLGVDYDPDYLAKAKVLEQCWLSRGVPGPHRPLTTLRPYGSRRFARLHPDSRESRRAETSPRRGPSAPRNH
jgi:L-alanine-DL-glutamate epimerase-like enolase superfamily enzyme